MNGDQEKSLKIILTKFKIKTMLLQRLICIFSIVFLVEISSHAQTRENIYRKPLKEVINEVATRFNVTIIYDEEQVKGKSVDFAAARISLNADQTLINVLGPFDMRFEKDGNRYILKNFQYYERSVKDGKEHLDQLLTSYPTLQMWEKRKLEVKNNIMKKIGLSPFPAKTPLNPVSKEKRNFKDYSVENIMIEIIPGVYLSGNLYKPAEIKEPVPAILCPHGHFTGGDIRKFDFSEWGRFREDMQLRCATLTQLGCIVFSYNMFAQGEMVYQIPYEEHFTPFALTMQLLSSIRVLDFITSIKDVDSKRIGITGASGGATQTILLTAVDDRVTLSVPAVMVSCYMAGGCSCETGLPIQYLDSGLNSCSPEIAALAAPRPQLLISVGHDWTAHNPDIEFPYLQKIYSLYDTKGNAELAYLPDEKHDYGKNKRLPMYKFVAKHFGLDIKKIENKNGEIDESTCTIESYNKLLSIRSTEELPPNALKSVTEMKNQLKSMQ